MPNEKNKFRVDERENNSTITSSDLKYILDVNKKAIEIYIEVDRQNEKILETFDELNKTIKEIQEKIENIDKSLFRLVLVLGSTGVGAVITALITIISMLVKK